MCAGLVRCVISTYALGSARQLMEKDVVELGTVLKDPRFQRRRQAEAKEGLEGSAISICDLTGVAVQDIAIAEMVYQQVASAKEHSPEWPELQTGEPERMEGPPKKRTKI